MDIEDFKAFVKTMPRLRDEVSNNHYTWQQLYEFYTLYGEEDDMWKEFKEKKKASTDSSLDLNSLISIVKNVDLEALSQSFEGIQKILDLCLTFVDTSKTKKRQWYDE